MKIELFEFQETAAGKLLGHLANARAAYERTGDLAAVGLTATTGAGKTVIATAVIEAVLFGSDDLQTEAQPDATFLWITDLPELNRQTIDKMVDAGSDLKADAITEIANSFNEPRLVPGRVYVINTQLLGLGALLTKTGPQVHRSFTFWDVIRKTVEEEPSRMLYLIVDEAHRGMSEATDGKKVLEANSIIQRFIKGYPEGNMPAAPVVLGISATPDKFTRLVSTTGRTTSHYQVPVEDVKASGLIKDHTFAEYAGEKQRDEMAVFPEAVKAWVEATGAWADYHRLYDGGEDPVIPALIIQVENETKDGKQITQTPLAAVIQAITEIAGPMPESAFVHAFGEKVAVKVGDRTVHYLEPSKIAGDTKARVVFFKAGLSTGWDCPRAEVMFSFRKAVDATSIAQTIGRMVRTPLHRRIDEDERLNAAHVFLPHYDAHAVAAILAKLNETGNEAIAGTIKAGREVAVLNLRTDQERAIAAIEATPSYLVGTPRARPEVRVLIDLANFLSTSGVDPDAYSRERADLVAILSAKRAALEASPAFVKEIDDQADILVLVSELADGELKATEKHLDTSEEGINRLYAEAKVKLVGDIAAAYVTGRLAEDPSTIRTARLEAYALSQRDEVTKALNQHASGRLDTLVQAFGSKIGTLTSAQQSRFKTIMRRANAPTLQTVGTLPAAAVFTRGANAPAGHLYADADGAAPIYLNTWERRAIEQEAAGPGFVGWLRCVDRAEWAVCVPWRDQNIVRGFYPDFLVVHEIDGEMRVSITDPHDHTKLDAIGKAQGLSAFAAEHADRFAHIDLVAEMKDGTLRRLHLDRAAIRKQVNALTNNNAELVNLYEREG
jgi:type III restriction enzyme